MKPAIIRPELKLKREIKELPVRNVIYIRLFGDYKLNDYCGTWMRLQQFVQEEKLPMGEVMPYCIFHDDPKVTPIEKLRTDVCMVMPAAVTPKGNIGFKQLPAGRYLHDEQFVPAACIQGGMCKSDSCTRHIGRIIVMSNFFITSRGGIEPNAP